MTIYSLAQWPLLQSLDEVKHKSGLFTCTATYVSPIGNKDMPEVIETSIGPVDVWPEPVVATGTDGLQRITATGYGVWDDQIVDITYGLEAAKIFVLYSLSDFCYNSAGCSYNGEDFTCGQFMGNTPEYRTLDVILETAHVRKIGSSLPTLPNQLNSTRKLRVFDTSLNDISDTEFSILEFAPSMLFVYNGAPTKKITAPIIPTQVRRNQYGTISEIEVIYTLNARLNFGTYSTKPQPCS